MIIYKITNFINDKIYIGQTSTTLLKRIAMYENEVYFSKNPRLIIRAMRKYGFDNFEFEVIDASATTQEELDELEKYYIKTLHSHYTENGYNVEWGGNSYGKHSEEVKKKISEAQKGEKNHMYGKTGENNPTSKKVIELTTGEIYGSAMDASRKLKINFSHVCAVARGKRGSTQGYVFRYLDKNNQIIQEGNFVQIKFYKTRKKILSEFLYLFPYFNN